MTRFHQAYVSQELTHFVGRKLPRGERYGLLHSIVDSGWLLPPPHVLDYGETGTLRIRGEGGLSDDAMYSPSCLCFCDIPTDSLALHMRKYSEFGLAFPKTFLSERNASPVFYIAQGSKVGLWNMSGPGIPTRGAHFDTNVKRFRNLFPVIRATLRESAVGTRENRVALEELEAFFNFYVFSFVKCFDETLTEEDVDNYYMEREWRMLGALEFTLDDVARIIVPEEYADRVRVDFPNFLGDLTLV